MSKLLIDPTGWPNKACSLVDVKVAFLPVRIAVAARGH
jgi:hypothetical protein